MKVSELCEACGFKPLNIADGDREVSGIYCCDLLSVVMSKGFPDCAWVTIMGNVNTTAVAQLTDMACVVLAQETALDEITVEKARMQEINLLKSDRPIFETALAIYNCIGGKNA